MDYPRFHLALPVDDLEAADHFYGELLGGRRGEQQTCFIRDPAGNHLEFKAFRNMNMLFATDGLDYP